MGKLEEFLSQIDALEGLKYENLLEYSHAIQLSYSTAVFQHQYRMLHHDEFLNIAIEKGQSFSHMDDPVPCHQELKRLF